MIPYLSSWKSKFVSVVVNWWNFFFQSFSLSDADHEVSSFLVDEREAFDDIPMVEHALRESLSLGVASQGSSEAEGFRDGEISFDLR